jgi:hypothetical protein
MDLLMDGLLATAALFAGGWCWVLARRVHDLKSLDKGLGASIVTLTRQIELARATLEEARGAARDQRHELGQMIARAETASAQLRLLLAAVREPEPRPAPEPPVAAQPQPAPVAIEPPVAAAELHVARPSEPPPALPPTPQPEAVRHLEAPAPAAPAAVATLSELPKPRALPPLDGLLRKRVRAAPEPESEDDLIEALTALAGGAR